MSLDTRARSIARSVMPIVRRDGYTTTPFAIAQALDDAGLRRINSEIISAIQAEFPADKFSSSIATLAYLRVFVDKYAMKVWSNISEATGSAF